MTYSLVRLRVQCLCNSKEGSYQVLKCKVIVLAKAYLRGLSVKYLRGIQYGYSFTSREKTHGEMENRQSHQAAYEAAEASRM